MHNIEIKHRVYILLSPDAVFAALASASEWNRWFTTECVIGAKVGDEVRFIWRDFGIDHEDLSDGGRVIEWERPERFGFNWHPGESTTSVRFTLNSRGSGTILTLHESGYSESTADFEAFKDCSVGWGEALILLKFYLEHGITYGAVPKE